MRLCLPKPDILQSAQKLPFEAMSMDETETTESESFAEGLEVIAQGREELIRTILDSCEPLCTYELAKPPDFLGKNNGLHLYFTYGPPRRNCAARQVFEKTGAPERIRTSGLCLRRAALYPAELRVPVPWRLSSIETIRARAFIAPGAPLSKGLAGAPVLNGSPSSLQAASSAL